jgi:MFS transporter, DHA1 family, tetracycline resistance protein
MTLTMTPVQAKRANFFILFTVFLDMVGFGIIIPVLPALIGAVGQVSLGEAAILGGWMTAGYALAQFLSGPFMGNLSDRFGRRPLLLIAIFGLGIDFLLHAVAPTLGWIFVGRIFAGFCGASWVIANAYIADVTPPEDRGRAFGMMGAAFGLGFVIGPALGGLLGEFGPRVPFYTAAAVSLLNFVFGYFVLPETLAVENRRPFEWARSNPFGAFRVFKSYPGVLPLCGVMAMFFFFTSVYPAIWPFWGKANFGWSEAMVGLSLAFFGVVMAAFQGGLTGPAVKRWGEEKVVMIGLVSAVLAMFGYGLVGSLFMVAVLIIVHGPEGFVQPMLTAILSKRVPENAQGELQGGISAITSIAMLLGTVFFAQVFGYFMRPDAVFQSPDVPFFVGGVGLCLTGLVMLALLRKSKNGSADG